MPLKRTIEKAREDKREGKSPTTQAGEFVHEKIRRIRHGEHGARSPEQAIAIGLSKASTRKSARYAYEAGQHKRKTHRGARVSPAVAGVLKHEPRSTASRAALSRHAARAAARRSPSERSAAARKAARTKGSAVRSSAAKKAARTRARHAG